MRRPAKILFVADAGPRVGGGHLMRCLTLAGALARAGAECGFMATAEAAAVLDAFAGESVRRFPAPSTGPSVLTALAGQAARTWGADVAVIDHYGLGIEADGALRAAAGRLLAIEDLRRVRDCDLLLDSNLGRSERDYPGAAVLAGPAYALVRPEFAAARPAALARRAEGGAVARVLVSLGLTDVGAITGRAVDALLPVLGDRRLDVAVGAGAPSLAKLQALADPRITLHVDTHDMAGLIAAADLAVGAGGSSAWERCVLGLATVTLILADNQRENTSALAAAGAAVALDVNAALDARLAEAVSALATDAPRRAAMSEAAAALCDGEGADRVAERMLGLTA